MTSRSTAQRLHLKRQILKATDQLRADIDAGVAPAPLGHVVHVNAGEEGDAQPEFVVVIVERGHESAVRDHFATHPLWAEPMTTATASGALAAGAERIEVLVAEQQNSFWAGPRDLDPRTMVGLDVDVAGHQLEADGWMVRPIKDGDVITADYRPNRVNLYHHTSTDRVVYRADVG